MGDRNAGRISVSEMKSYYVYSEWCSWLLSVAEGESLGPINHCPFGALTGDVVGVVRPPGFDGLCFDVLVTWVVQCRDGSYRVLVLTREDVFMNPVICVPLAFRIIAQETAIISK